MLERKQSLDEYNLIVGSKPERYKPRQHPTIKVEKNVKGVKTRVPLEYYEIGFVEANLDRVFNGLWNDEVVDTKLIANSVVVTVKLWYYNPAMEVWQFKTGIGAAPIQTNAGAGPTDFSQIKTSGVQIAAPAAKSFALKNAAQQIGNAFGRHLNREFDFDYVKDDRMDKILSKEDKRIIEFIENAETTQQLSEVEPHLKNDEQREFFKEKQQKLEL